MILTLSKETIGTPSTPKEWSNKKQTHVPVDYKQLFIKQLEQIHADNGKTEDPLVYMGDTIEDPQHFHLNYLTYLEKCWSDHLGIVISPDIIWYTLLSELTIIIKKQPEAFRPLFSKSDEKQNIIIPCDDPVVIDLDTLIKALSDKVPTDASHFLPEFTTSTVKSLHAFQATFCDMCSPYYNYMMYMCNIPKVDVQGTIDDWKSLSDKWFQLSTMVLGRHDAWSTSVSRILDALVKSFSDTEFWKAIFNIKHCGSGGQTEIFGWFVDLFCTQPRIRYASNYSNHVSVVDYKQLSGDVDYKMSVGLFGSNMQDGFMVPDFSYVVHQVI